MEIYFYKNDLPDDLILKGDIAVDTESMGLNFQQRDRLCLVQISNGDGNAHIVNFSEGNYEAPNLRKILADETRCKIFHFARFDIAIIKKYLDINITNIFCTKISSRLVRTYTDSHGLKDLCKDLISVTLSKQQQTSDWGSNELSKDQLKYAAHDVIYLHRLKEKLLKLLHREGRFDLAQKCFNFLPTRAELDIMGWHEIDIFQH